jgi:predicted small lipoprotein YifL
MPRNRGRRSVLVSVAVCLLVLAGCGKKNAIVNGKIILPANIKLIESDRGKIIFVPEDKNAPASSATISSSDNSFVVNGPANKGVPLGKYKITVQLQPYPGEKGSEKRSDLFARLNDKYDPEVSKLTYEVTADSTQSITINLIKGTVTKD